MAISKAEPGKTRMGWIGTGVMGRWMCQHLMTKGYKATVFNRSKDKADAALEAGAAWADSPQKVAQNADVIFGIVGFPKDVREVYLGPSGALAGAKAGAVLVDMTTSEPSLAVEIYEAAKAKGVYSVDAPVSGGDVGAKNAGLSIMIGGDKDVVEAHAALVRVHGQNHHPSRRRRRRPTHQDGQSDSHRLQHGRRLRGAPLWLQGGARPGDGAQIRVASAPPAASRWKSSARAFWPAISSPASMSSISSKTWASPWTNPNASASSCLAWPSPTNFISPSRRKAMAAKVPKP